MRGWAFDQSVNWFQLTFENGHRLEAQFQITSYERAGDHDGAETYAITLASHGTPNFVAA